MKYILKNGQKISKLCLGTVQFGLDYGIANSSGKPSQTNVNEIIEYLSHEGVNCFDTAQAYGNAEVVLGKALTQRQDNFIISKISSDLFREDAYSSISRSLQNLNIDSLYALLLHDTKRLASWQTDDTLTVKNLIQSSKIKYFGVSIYTTEDFNLALKNKEIDFIQIPFNLFDQRAITENWFKRAKENNKLLFIRSIYLQGLLLMDKDKIPSKLESAKKYMDIIELFTKKLDISKNTLALSFVATVAQDSLLLFGCETLDQAKENLASYNTRKKLDTKTIQDIINKLKNIDATIYNPTRW